MNVFRGLSFESDAEIGQIGRFWAGTCKAFLEMETLLLMKMDETNIEIIKLLQDGRRSFRKIADEVGVSENTVRTRVADMIDAGLLQISGLVDPEGIPGHRFVLVGVKLKTMELVKKGEEFSKLRGIVSVNVVTGRYDLILQVLLNNDFGLLEFYTQEVSRIKDVQSVETFVVYKGYNAKVPYVL